jgi:hypothetical protein
MMPVLRLAGVYNVLWGAWCILFPAHFWRLLGMPEPNYPFLWQCIGMIVGVYGLGYWIASRDIARHWPIVLVGLLGKILGPMGFVQAHYIDGAVPLRFGITLLTNDLIWWAPFILMLRHAYRVNESQRLASILDSAPPQPPALAEALAQARLKTGESLAQLASQTPVLTVCLRHMGCTFCRETLADLAGVRSMLESHGITICLVHMVADERAHATFQNYGLDDLPRVSDPKKHLYNALSLSKGTAQSLFGWRSIVRFFTAGVVRRHGVGPLAGDGFQMPGAFLIHQGRVLRAFRHETAADRPDYCVVAGIA